MIDEPCFLPASSFALDALADILTRSFEEYFYTSNTSAEDLARRIRMENIDLCRSVVMLVSDQPAGMALMALRSYRGWCGGFGVTLPFRGLGLSHRLADALLDQARQAGMHSFGLEVLTRNQRAIATYSRAGLQIRRDLHIFEWKRPEEETGRPFIAPTIVSAPPELLLDYFPALHPVPAAWQRDLPSLLVRRKMHGLAILRRGKPAAYVLFSIVDDDTAHVIDLGAERARDVRVLLGALKATSTRIVDINEPADSPFIAAFLSAGFGEIDRQHEMEIDLL